MTERVIRALTNRHVTVLAHPTGRLLGQREPSQIDLDKILDIAKSEGVALEINSQPDRLDLPDIWVLEAKKRGVDMVISSDAHSLESLGTIQFGVLTARRGWLERNDVLNTLSLQGLMKRLGRTGMRG
jgi:DNA polymerase (family 10)